MLGILCKGMGILPKKKKQLDLRMKYTIYMYNCIRGILPKRRKKWKKQFDIYFANINMVGVLPKKKKLLLPRLKYVSFTNIGHQWLTMHINGLVKLTHCQKKYTMGNAFRVENEFFHKETSKTLLIDFSVVSTKLVLPMLCMNKIRF